MVVEVRAQLLALEECEPLREGVAERPIAGEEVTVRVVVVVILRANFWMRVVGALAGIQVVTRRVSPIHVECPDVDGQVATLPARNIILGLLLRVRVPVCEPRSERIVRQYGARSGERNKLSAAGVVAGEALSEQKDVEIARLVIREVVTIGCDQRGVDCCVDWDGRHGPRRREETWVILDSIGRRGFTRLRHRGRPEQVAADVIQVISREEHGAIRRRDRR